MDIVKLGSVVTVYDFDLKEEISYKIVKMVDTYSFNENEISQDTPLAKALLGKFAGIQEVDAPDGKYKVKISSIDNSFAENNEIIKQVDELRKIIQKTEHEQRIKEEKKRQAGNLSGYYQTHPYQGGGVSSK